MRLLSFLPLSHMCEYLGGFVCVLLAGASVSYLTSRQPAVVRRTFRECRFLFFFSSRRRHTRLVSDWSSDVCSSDLFVIWASSHFSANSPRAASTSFRCRPTIPLESTRIRFAGFALAVMRIFAVRMFEIGRASCRERV